MTTRRARGATRSLSRDRSNGGLSEGGPAREGSAGRECGGGCALPSEPLAIVADCAVGAPIVATVVVVAQV